MWDRPRVTGYSAREVARMVGLSVGQVRAYVRAGFLEPLRGDRGELRFSFQDLVLLRTAKGLMLARIPQRRVRMALERLRQKLPEGRELRTLRIAAEGDDIVVGDGALRFSADDGQILFDFDTAELARKAAPALIKVARTQAAVTGASAHEWYERGCDLEEAAPNDARAAYRRALELDPSHPDAHVNLGRLLHEGGDAGAAIAQYREALRARPDDATAWFNLGVALEDTGDLAEALAAYLRAIAADPAAADAHFNAGRLYEKKRQPTFAIRHLRTYRKLTEPR